MPGETEVNHETPQLKLIVPGR